MTCFAHGRSLCDAYKNSSSHAKAYYALLQCTIMCFRHNMGFVSDTYLIYCKIGSHPLLHFPCGKVGPHANGFGPSGTTNSHNVSRWTSAFNWCYLDCIPVAHDKPRWVQLKRYESTKGCGLA